jgi:hypothetical protein
MIFFILIKFIKKNYKMPFVELFVVRDNFMEFAIRRQMLREGWKWKSSRFFREITSF